MGRGFIAGLWVSALVGMPRIGFGPPYRPFAVQGGTPARVGRAPRLAATPLYFSSTAFINFICLAPGAGFEPASPRRDTGSQGLRLDLENPSI